MRYLVKIIKLIVILKNIHIRMKYDLTAKLFHVYYLDTNKKIRTLKLANWEKKGKLLIFV